MYDITISIVAYRNYKDIKEAITTIEEYTNSTINKKIYIIDNSCYADDNSEKKSFVEFLSNWAEIEYIDTGANLGFGKGHNYVLRELDSKYHAIVNPDILLVEDSFSMIMEYMDRENVGMVIPKLIDEKGNMLKAYRRDVTVGDMIIRFMDIDLLFRRRKNHHTMDDMDYEKPFDVPFAQGSFLVADTKLLKELNGFDDRFFMYMEDADLCKRVNEISCVRYIPYTKVIHKWEKGSHKNMKLLKIHVQSMYKYFKKWGFRFF